MILTFTIEIMKMRPVITVFSLFLLVNKLGSVRAQCGEVVFGGLGGSTDNYIGTIKYLPQVS